MGFDTKNIRNVALLGHSGSGKTTLAETMLFEAGEVNRRGTVEEQNTVSDYTDIEHERGNSIFSTLMHDEWKDSKLNILDTPGFDDFIGEVVSSLKVADIGVMVINARNGVEVGTDLIWEYVQDFKTPRCSSSTSSTTKRPITTSLSNRSKVTSANTRSYRFSIRLIPARASTPSSTRCA
jgi:elongation factor G